MSLVLPITIHNLLVYQQLLSSYSAFFGEHILQLECGPMPNVMVALLNIGGALCSTPQSLADAHYLTAVQ